MAPRTKQGFGFITQEQQKRTEDRILHQGTNPNVSLRAEGRRSASEKPTAVRRARRRARARQRQFDSQRLLNAPTANDKGYFNISKLLLRLGIKL